MRPDSTNDFKLFQGTQEQWTDSLRRSDAYHRYVLRKPKLLELGFIDKSNPRLALAEYALSIGIQIDQKED